MYPISNRLKFLIPYSFYCDCTLTLTLPPLFSIIATRAIFITAFSLTFVICRCGIFLGIHRYSFSSSIFLFVIVIFVQILKNKKKTCSENRLVRRRLRILISFHNLTHQSKQLCKYPRQISLEYYLFRCCSSNIDLSDESEDELARIRARARFPDTTRLEKNDISVVTKNTSGVTDEKNMSIIPLIEKRTLKPNGFSINEKCRIGNSLLPNKPKVIRDFGSKVFCGLYSKDGEFFIASTQDKWMYIYKMVNGNYVIYNRMLAHDVGWSVLDIAFSPDGQHFAYSSWADCLYQCHISDRSIDTLALHPGVRRFCVFSLVFSNNGHEILGGANDRCIYMYDVHCQRFDRFTGHDEDVNCVAYADNSSQIFYSAGDDGFCKVWDRRLINMSNPSPVGILAGHRDGITYIDSRGDTRYLITNSKDQSIKLWDTRVFSSRKAQQNARHLVERKDWDYRWQPVPQRLWDRGFLDGDTSVMTYYGHSVRKTLIRCRFSPPDNTGQRYIYTGDSTGRLIIYDLLTGKIVRKVKGHLGCIRDVSWHPFDHNLITSSWDGKISKWEYSESYDANEYEPPLLRRSERIAARRRTHVS
ncbi:DDB1- and CUL4-associated factor 11 [Cyphomyrmex costatus]|uniref:DDB1-and CUL4-associated factor 11 n=1 Tax=Cyphomyrmex costatus TaxID=456900 RepID=A0A195C0A9_9HYME|nr:DDB1- and CUL4-associated factor 11 [Cyphomyrmex costatus]